MFSVNEINQAIKQVRNGVKFLSYVIDEHRRGSAPKYMADMARDFLAVLERAVRNVNAGDDTAGKPKKEDR